MLNEVQRKRAESAVEEIDKALEHLQKAKLYIDAPDFSTHRRHLDDGLLAIKATRGIVAYDSRRLS